MWKFALEPEIALGDNVLNTPCGLHGSPRAGDAHSLEAKGSVVIAHAQFGGCAAKTQSRQKVSRRASGYPGDSAHLGFNSGIPPSRSLSDSRRSDNGKGNDMAGIAKEVPPGCPAFIKIVPGDFFVGTRQQAPSPERRIDHQSLKPGS